MATTYISDLDLHHLTLICLQTPLPAVRHYPQYAMTYVRGIYNSIGYTSKLPTLMGSNLLKYCHQLLTFITYYTHDKRNYGVMVVP